MLRNFLFASATAAAIGRWRSFIEDTIRDIRAQVGTSKVLCALSGGVDSSVVALLIHKAIGSQLTCMFIDHGLLRKDEAEASWTHSWANSI